MIKKTINFLIYSLVLFLPLYLVRFSIFGWPTNIIEMLVLITFLLWLFDFKKESAIFSVPKVFYFSISLIFLGLFFSAWSGGISPKELGIIKGWFIVPFLFFLVILDRLDSLEKIERVLKFLFVSSVGVGILGLFYLWLGKITFDGRLQSIFNSPNFLAMFLAPAIIFGLISLGKIILKTKEYGRPFYFLLLGLLILIANLYATFSYASWMALFLSLVLILGLAPFFNRSQKINISLLFSAILIIFFVFQFSQSKMTNLVNLEERSSLASRSMIWQAALQIGNDNFFWGIGPGNFQEKYLEYQKYFPPYLEWAVPQPHNIFLAFWLQSGVLGLIGFLILVGSWIINVIKGLEKEKGSLLGTALLASLFYILIHGMVDTPYWKNDLALLFWLIIALGFVFLGKINPKQVTIGSIDEK